MGLLLWLWYGMGWLVGTAALAGVVFFEIVISAPIVAAIVYFLGFNPFSRLGSVHIRLVSFVAKRIGTGGCSGTRGIRTELLDMGLAHSTNEGDPEFMLGNSKL